VRAKWEGFLSISLVAQVPHMRSSDETVFPLHDPFKRNVMAPGPRRNTRTTVSSERRSAWLDDSGAVMVIGVFMAMLVTGFLYYIIGIGNTIIYRERMQDAADAIAFSGAVTYARGLNLIALINIILTLLMVIHMAMRLVQTALFITALICGLGACPPLVVPLETAEQWLERLADAYDTTILQPALSLGHTASGVIREAWPQIAQGRVVLSTVGGSYQPPVTFGTLVPVPARALPVKPVPLRVLCDHAARQLSAALTFPLSVLPPAVRNAIASALARFTALAFCPQDRSDWRPYDLDRGTGSCRDGLPGNDCEYAQIRGVVYASRTPSEGNERGVAVANWGRTAGGGLSSAFEPFTHIGIAQAEYYYDDPENDTDEWMWHMYWRARLRRVRLNGLTIPGVGGINLNVIDQMIVH